MGIPYSKADTRFLLLRSDFSCEKKKKKKKLLKEKKAEWGWPRCGLRASAAASAAYESRSLALAAPACAWPQAKQQYFAC